ncbi:hypothetical protein [Sinorhizobium fredii]|uniref:hypothetical protein n=1 Tax=Rhizobium fredii TaxID=380 RepID=UPI00351929E1
MTYKRRRPHAIAIARADATRPQGELIAFAATIALFATARSRNFLLHLTSPPRSDVLRAPLPPMGAQASRCRSGTLRQYRPPVSAALIKILIVQNEYGEDESPSGSAA